MRFSAKWVLTFSNKHHQIEFDKVAAEPCRDETATASNSIWWTRGESNPLLFHAMEACYRYTTGPITATFGENTKSEFLSMVPRRGLEPPQGFPHMHLKHARIPNSATWALIFSFLSISFYTYPANNTI